MTPSMQSARQIFVAGVSFAVVGLVALGMAFFISDDVPPHMPDSTVFSPTSVPETSSTIVQPATTPATTSPTPTTQVLQPTSTVGESTLPSTITEPTAPVPVPGPRLDEERN